MAKFIVLPGLLLIGVLSFTRSQPVPAITPLMLAEKVADRIYSNKGNFFKWDYTGAIIFDALYQSDEIFHMNYTPIIDSYLDKWMTDKDSFGYKLIHDEPIEIGHAVGDTISLFPINYLNRILTAPNTTKPMFDKMLYERLIENDVTKYILNWPYKLPDGTFSRYKGWEGQPVQNAPFIWADDQYMGLTLLARISAYVRTNTSMELARTIGEMALHFAEYLRDPQDGLFYHGYNHVTRQHSCCKWGRGNGWGLMSHIEVLNALNNHPALVESTMFEKLKMILEEHVKAMIRHQPLEGRWHQVVDDRDTYLETSVTSMTLYTLTKGVLQHWIQPSLEVHSAIMKAWEGLIKVIDIKDGTVSGICTGTGILNSPGEYNHSPTEYIISNPGLGSVLYAINYMELYTRHRQQGQKENPFSLL